MADPSNVPLDDDLACLFQVGRELRRLDDSNHLPKDASVSPATCYEPLRDHRGFTSASVPTLSLAEMALAAPH